MWFSFRFTEVGLTFIGGDTPALKPRLAALNLWGAEKPYLHLIPALFIRSLRGGYRSLAIISITGVSRGIQTQRSLDDKHAIVFHTCLVSMWPHSPWFLNMTECFRGVRKGTRALWRSWWGRCFEESPATRREDRWMINRQQWTHLLALWFASVFTAFHDGLSIRRPDLLCVSLCCVLRSWRGGGF